MSKKTIHRGRVTKIYGEDISWVGECPWIGSYGFGSESGKFFAMPDPTESAGMLPTLSVASDAVNGGAFSGEFCAFSSRDSLFFGKRITPGRFDVKHVPVPYDGGAHGVVASSKGGFLAPIGPAGIMLFSHSATESEFQLRYIQQDKDPFYGYKMVRIGQKAQAEVFAVAARNHGVIGFEYTNPLAMYSASFHSFHPKDIVSVCPLNNAKYPFGVVALSKDNTVLLINDITTGDDSSVTGYADLPGVGYSVLSSHDHLFVLHSMGISRFPNIIAKFVKGELRGEVGSIVNMPIEATAFYLLGDDTLFVLDEGVATEFSIKDLFVSDQSTTAAKNTGKGLPKSKERSVIQSERTFESETVRLHEVWHGQWNGSKRNIQVVNC